jgi:hypothetical protein
MPPGVVGDGSEDVGDAEGVLAQPSMPNDAPPEPCESGGAKTGHGSGGIVRPRAE